MQTGTTSLISVPTSGTSGANGISANPTISADGRYVEFDSAASNLVASDSNGATRDEFVRDRQSNTTTLVSRATNGTSSGNNESFGGRISADGRYVVFMPGSLPRCCRPASRRPPTGNWRCRRWRCSRRWRC